MTVIMPPILDLPTAEACHFLLLARDGQRSSSLEQLLRLFGVVEVHDLADVPPEAADTKAAMLVVNGVRLGDDIAFRDLDRWRHRQGTELPLLCLLDRPTRRDVVRLKLLGEAVLLPEDAGAATVMAALGRLGRIPQVRSSGAFGEAGLALADALSCAASGQPIDRTACAAVSRAVTRALVEKGLAAWMRLVGTIHDSTYRHCLLVSGLVSAFAIHLGYGAADVELFTEAAMLHDLGKALVPPAIIDKPGPLSDAETAIMRRHPEDGFDLLLRQGGFDPTVLAVVRSHHELLDGTGYPDGLFRHQIPAAVRIVTVCDIFAALIENRSYKPGLSVEAAHAALDEWGDTLDRRYVIALRCCLQPLLSSPEPPVADGC